MIMHKICHTFKTKSVNFEHLKKFTRIKESETHIEDEIESFLKIICIF